MCLYLNDIEFLLILACSDDSFEVNRIHNALIYEEREFVMENTVSSSLFYSRWIQSDS